MPDHEVLKSSLVIDSALKLLRRERILAAMVTDHGVSNWGGSEGDTITIRVPGVMRANQRGIRDANRTLAESSIVEYPVPVTIDKHLYQAVPMKDEQLSLDIRDWARQVLFPMVQSIGELNESNLASLIETAPYQETIAIDPTDTFKAFSTAVQRLSETNVPKPGRVLVVGSAVATALRNDTQFRHADFSGDAANSALREAWVSRIAGMNVIESQWISQDSAYIFHPTAFLVTYQAPAVPRGVSYGSSAAVDGLALRFLADYNYGGLNDRYVLDTYAGYNTISDPDQGFVRAVKLRLAMTGNINVVSAGGVAPTMAVGDTLQLKIRDDNGALITDRCTFVSGTPAKATVTAGPGYENGGLVTAVAAGTSAITVTYAGPSGNKTATVNVTVA
ncbi:P22 phage major capsid protein family protein [Mycobacteroides abscessus]|uniref:P22 phage major capsid protein family protein n=1 Tax=Mycobacteroides abscessus TaxID=36809 RepID=UPI000D3E6D5D|nr:P22 phage major capsid protein family protein [Mycobacteroides abscessus]PVB19739.1 hypothetical protein DDJ40_08245 [Mycobacteroides abscessus]RIU40342.1 hypothetical protein D2E83_11260 [Mycobacteroides abscessus]